jgi:hypothetical protein
MAPWLQTGACCPRSDRMTHLADSVLIRRAVGSDQPQRRAGRGSRRASSSGAEARTSHLEH